MVMRVEGKWDSAQALSRQSLEIKRALFPGDNDEVALALNFVGLAYYMQRDYAQAIPYLREATTMYGRSPGQSRENYWGLANNLARALRESGNAVAAESIFRAAIVQLDTTQIVLRRQLVAAHVGVGLSLLDQHHPVNEALPHLRLAGALADRLKTTEIVRGEAAIGQAIGLMAAGDYAPAARALADAELSIRPHALGQPILAARLDSAEARLRRLAPRAVVARSP